MTDIEQRKAAFGARLRAIRAEAGYLTGKDYAHALGWQQSRVSRIETGKQTVTDSDVITWCQTADVPESVTSALLDELREIKIEAASWRRQLSTGHAPRATQVRTTEADTTTIRAFELALLPGLVQTPDYARHVLLSHARLHDSSTVDIDESVRLRMDRQHVLYDSGRATELLLTESALRYPVGPPAVMAAQLDRLLTVCGLGAVRFGIIPLGVTMPVIPMNGFWILDDNKVVVETTDSEVTAEDPADILLYNRVMDELWTVAVEGNDARALLLRLARSYTEKRDF